MKDSFMRFGGTSAMLVGVLSILYAVFFLGIARQAQYLGTLGSWVILAASGVFSSAAYVALFLRLRPVSEGAALWGLVLGAGSSLATLLHGAYEAQVLSAVRGAEGPSRAALEAAAHLPSQVDPGGIAAFFVVGVVSFVFSWLMLQASSPLPRTLGYLGLFNALLLVVLYFANLAGLQPLVLLSGGLTSVLVGPAWWIWLGRQLMKA